MKKVMVLMGGFSAEREVSLVSGKGVLEALIRAGYAAYAYDLKNIDDFLAEIKGNRPDVVFNALHGNWGEDGEIQALLDLMQIPYTHSGMKASLLGMDKELTKMVAAGVGIKIAESEKLTFASLLQNGTKIPLPYVVKPVADGSSVGVFIVQTESDLAQVNYDDENREILVEKYIAGRELTCAVYNGKALAVTELCPHAAFYNYQAKYTNGMTQHEVPANLAPEVENTVKKYAEKLHKALGCNMLSRSDFRYNDIDGVVLLEVNTNPGMTPLSLVPEQALFVGISYEELCSGMVEHAQCRKL